MPPRTKYIYFSRFGLKTGLHFAHFGLESGIVFDGITGVYERICYFSSKMNTEKGRVIYKFEVDTPKTAHTICVCNRLLFYGKCIGFTICLIYSDKLMYITQCEINVELPNLRYIVVLLPQKRFFQRIWRIFSLPFTVRLIIEGTGRWTANSKSLKKPLLRQKDDSIPQVR